MLTDRKRVACLVNLLEFRLHLNIYTHTLTHSPMFISAHTHTDALIYWQCRTGRSKRLHFDTTIQYNISRMTHKRDTPIPMPSYGCVVNDMHVCVPDIQTFIRWTRMYLYTKRLLLAWFLFICQYKKTHTHTRICT